MSCLPTIDFMFGYANLYMQLRPKSLRHVILNIYGGESLHHPNIVEILQQVRLRHAQYKDQWDLVVTTTTNAIVSEKKLANILPLIDEFTVSYHTESSDKQKETFRTNLLAIKAAGRKQKCIVLMHAETDKFDDATQMIAWLEQNNINYLPKALDADAHRVEFFYQEKQLHWFRNVFEKNSFNAESTALDFVPQSPVTDLAGLGRSCCGGKQLCYNQNQRSRHGFVANKFPNWFCSVNHFFVYVKQYTGDIFTNKDCRMNFDQQVAPIGNMANYQKLISDTELALTTNTLPVIQCKKSRCLCGLCAPKAANLETYNNIMSKYFAT